VVESKNSATEKAKAMPSTLDVLCKHDNYDSDDGNNYDSDDGNNAYANSNSWFKCVFSKGWLAE
jgi:hypothetical protein